MRAFYVPEIQKEQNIYLIRGDDFTHFTKVLRGKVGSDVLLMNGEGLFAYGIVDELRKKELEVRIKSFESKDRLIYSQLALCVPKKDYLNDILKMATEVGVFKVHLIVSDNTPWKFTYSDRFDKIMKSALLQSNNPYLPEIITYKSMFDFLEKNESLKITVFLTESSDKSEVKHSQCVLVGPEGGFSLEEINTLKQAKQVSLHRLPNPIMKSVTASIFALGHIQPL